MGATAAAAAASAGVVQGSTRGGSAYFTLALGRVCCRGQAHGNSPDGVSSGGGDGNGGSGSVGDGGGGSGIVGGRSHAQVRTPQRVVRKRAHLADVAAVNIFSGGGHLQAPLWSF